MFAEVAVAARDLRRQKLDERERRLQALTIPVGAAAALFSLLRPTTGLLLQTFGLHRTPLILLLFIVPTVISLSSWVRREARARPGHALAPCGSVGDA